MANFWEKDSIIINKNSNFWENDLIISNKKPQTPATQEQIQDHLQKRKN